MARPPHARERVLDAYEVILIDEGERAATLDATARAADVSKGGLLYHFASKDDLVAGLIQRLDDQLEADVTAMNTAPEGVVAYYLRTSVINDNPLEHPLDRCFIAVTRLAQGGDESAAEALRRVRARWADTIRPHVRDEAALALVMLVSDGLYFNNALDAGNLGGPVPRGHELDALIALVQTSSAPSEATGSAAAV
ncbi:TetR/AcrR family transcriptional regulator [Microbacterium sp. YY-01]|uniref:TetR/AcrR family transcriptional regulator n=1 Tax=Microbacterium sp. YY-01 TaxID=3421634 RepID=UPI003D163D00